MKRLLKRLIQERCPRFPTFDKNKKLASDFERQERQGWGRGGHREAEADRDYPQTQERGMTGVVTQTISDYNFNPHYYHDKEDFPNPVIIVKSREHNNKKTVLNVGGERHEVAWRTLMSAPLTKLGRLTLANTHDEMCVITFNDDPEASRKLRYCLDWYT